MDVGSFPKRLDRVGMPTGSYTDVFINHIPVVYPSGSFAMQIAPAICEKRGGADSPLNTRSPRNPSPHLYKN
jgi:hypothetical protein